MTYRPPKPPRRLHTSRHPCPRCGTVLEVRALEVHDPAEAVGAEPVPEPAGYRVAREVPRPPPAPIPRDPWPEIAAAERRDSIETWAFGALIFGLPVAMVAAAILMRGC